MAFALTTITAPFCLQPSKRLVTSSSTTVKNSKTNYTACVSVKASRIGSSKGGSGLLERPSFDRSIFDPNSLPQIQEGGDRGRVRDKRGNGSGDSYRVLLIDDARHSEKLVVNVLPKVVPSVTPDKARRLFAESKEKGVAVVIVTVKEHAEFYAQMMIRGGLRSKIEPESSTV